MYTHLTDEKPKKDKEEKEKVKKEKDEFDDYDDDDVEDDEEDDPNCQNDPTYSELFDSTIPFKNRKKICVKEKCNCHEMGFRSAMRRYLCCSNYRGNIRDKCCRMCRRYKLDSDTCVRINGVR